MEEPLSRPKAVETEEDVSELSREEEEEEEIDDDFDALTESESIAGRPHRLILDEKKIQADEQNDKEN